MHFGFTTNRFSMIYWSNMHHGLLSLFLEITIRHSSTRHVKSLVWTLTFFIISADRLQNFEICVGLDGSEIGNNAICGTGLEPIGSMATKRFSCVPSLYGDWISVNKTITVASGGGSEILQLQEVQVFGSRYFLTLVFTVYLFYFCWLFISRT